MKAWVTKETVVDGKRKRAKCGLGVRGVGSTDRFVVEYFDQTGKRRREKVGRSGKGGRIDAEARANEITSAVTMGTFEAKNLATWAEFRAEYEEKGMVGMGGASRLVTNIALDTFERLASPARMSTITTKTFADYVARRSDEPNRRARESKRPTRSKNEPAKPVSKATINRELRTVKAALSKAKRWGYIKEVPYVDFLKEVKKIPTYVPPEHFVAMYEACDAARIPSNIENVSPPAWWLALLVTAYMTGWRIGELLTLEWENVDLDAGTAFIRGDQTKGRRDEIIPLHPTIVDHLLKIQTFSKQVFPHSGPRRPLWDQFARIQDAAGIKPDRKARYGFHDLRRGFGTMNADRMTPDALQRLMRHQSYSTTQLYINLARQLKPATENLFVPSLPGSARTGSEK